MKKKSLSITSALLLHIILLHDNNNNAFSTAETIESSSLVIIDDDEEEDLILPNTLQKHTNKEDEEKRHSSGKDNHHNVLQQQVKSLMGRYAHHHRNNIAPLLTNYLDRILAQRTNIKFPQFKQFLFHRKRKRRTTTTTTSLTEKENDKTKEHLVKSSSSRGIQYYNNLVHNKVVDYNVKETMSNNAAVNVKWVRGWCPPPPPSSLETSATSDDEDDKSIQVVETDGTAACTSSERMNGNVGKNDDSSSSNNIQEEKEEDDDVQPGMVLFVETSSPDSSSAGGSSSSSNGENAISTVDNGAACLTVLGQQYDHNREILQYILLEQELHLGNIDVHKRDFAYHPVVASISTEAAAAEENAVEAFKTRYDDSQPKREEGVQDDDRQVSFRWWSWVGHLSQILHGGFHNTGDDDDKKRDNYNKQQHSSSSSYRSSIYEEVGKSAFAGGSHGEVWRARRRCPSGSASSSAVGDDENEGNSTTTTQSSSSSFSSSCDDGKDLIAKRLKIELGYSILEAGLREVYFGELLGREVESPTLFTTYVDHFFREGRRGQVELWIVFENAGPSLRSYMYEATVADGFVVFQHSAFWQRLRMGISRSHSHETMDGNAQSKNDTDADGNGRHLLKEVLKQILKSVDFLHQRGIIHRDVKPSNILCKTTPSSQDGIIPDLISDVNCVLADFSSCYDDFVERNLYGKGPTAAEQTDEYAPPEVLLQGLSPWEPFSSANPYSYDSWSIGVLALELLLGTPNVFSVDQRTTALLTNKLQNEGASSSEIKKALYLAALSQFCIYVPTNGMNWPLRKGDPLDDISVAKHSCTLHDFHNALRARDPLGVGFDSSTDLLLHLIWRLLDWDPLTRISPADALSHPYFTESNNHSHPNNGKSPPVEKLLFRKPLNDFMIPGSHNALEHQTLDPRVDMNSSDTVAEFVCPKCGKKYSDHNSCQMHARSRKHGLFCTYDVTLLPQCIHTHSMLPTHSTSGYCDIQGRRRTIEDFHTIHLNEDHQFYGIFDGHMGNIASKFSASSFYNEVEERLSTVDKEIKSSNSDWKWKEGVKVNMEQSFYNLHEGILEAINSSPTGVMREAGTTATILHVTDLAVIIANVGDSRAVLSSWDHDGNNARVTGMQLTVDHVASCPKEQGEVIERGGFISKSGGIDRVNGSLAVSRSLGDVKLAPYLSQIPDVLALTKDEVHKRCSNDQSIPGPDNQDEPCFIIVASDGLWDVVDNQEAVEFVAQVLRETKASYQTAAQLITQEAYVRGSSDNIGVLIVAI